MKKRIVILSALMASTALLAVGCTRTNDRAGTNDSAAVQTLLNKIDDTQKNDETETSEKNDMEQSTDEADKSDNKSSNSEIDAELAGIKAQSDEINDKLDDDTMSKLTEDERNWIADKEAKVKAAGADSEGGSLQPLLENSEAAELTQARVYYLAQYLR